MISSKDITQVKMAKPGIAICGGGIASLFEASSKFREESAAIGLGCNAQTALNLISPILREALDEAGGVRMSPSVRMMMGAGPHCGLHIGDIDTAIPQITVHRGAFWRALHSKLPDGVLEFRKRLNRIEETSTGIKLHFEDGSSYEADALVGCDGINSVTREYILGDNPATKASYTKGYDHRIVIPINEARKTFGEKYCTLKTQHGWMGPNAVLITDIEDDGESMQCIVGGMSDGVVWPHSAPWVEWPKEKLQEKLADWGEFGQAMLKVYMDQPTFYAAGGRKHLETPTFCKGAICIAGDAAHTFSPAQGAGAGQAIEDSLMLSTVINACSTTVDIPRAFKVYNEMRRPRRLDVAKSSDRAHMILLGKQPGVGMDPTKIAETLKDWGSNIYGYDLEAAQYEARKRMQSVE